MDVRRILKGEQPFFTYGDNDDMVNDAAQIFALDLHKQWWETRKGGNTIKENGANKAMTNELLVTHNQSLNESAAFRQRETLSNNEGDHLSTSGWYDFDTPVDKDQDAGILIFVSMQDQVCFTSTGSAMSRVLPWWRLDEVVSSMNPELRFGDYGGAILTAIYRLTDMLHEGPPTFMDKVHDFCTRFGLVIIMSLFTFSLGAWGEVRDHRRRREFADVRSKLDPEEREKAREKQKEYKTKECPICLEAFTKEETECDTDGIPLKGPDSKNIKFLRCGHIFCESCWQAWVRSGFGDPCFCPVCRQDVGKPDSKKRRSKERRRAARRARRQAAAAAATASNNSTAARRSSASTTNTSTEQSSLTLMAGDEDQSLGGRGNAVPTYGSLQDNTRITDTRSIISSSTTSTDYSEREREDNLIAMGANMWASTFGPARSNRSMNRGRSPNRWNSPNSFGSLDESISPELA